MKWPNDVHHLQTKRSAMRTDTVNGSRVFQP